MNSTSTFLPDDFDEDDELLAAFIRESERLEPQEFNLADWIARAPHLKERLVRLLETHRALEQSRPAAELPLPERIAEFRIVRRIAGNLGDVYEAIQEPLNRRVAVKTIRRGRFSPDMQARFLREQHVLASLHQTHIVPIHTAGQDGELRYFAMPYIEGAALHNVVNVLGELQSSHPGSRTPALGDLARIANTDTADLTAGTVTHVGDIRLSEYGQAGAATTGKRRHSTDYLRSVATVMADVADAVQHAHNQNILHRDIKPSNIMVDTRQQSWIIDFGLARFLTELVEGAAPDAPLVAEASLSSAAGVIGTPPYMAPEQFEGKADARSDVWGLGVTLYELLTLQRPFAGENLPALRKAVCEWQPAAPRQLVAGLPADLEAICVKAMQKDAGQRYQSAAEFAEDLRRWLRFEPTTALPARSLRRFVLWCRRHPARAVTLAAAFIALVLGTLLGVSNHFSNLRAERAETLQRSAEALQQRGEALQLLQKLNHIRLIPHRSGWSHSTLKLANDAPAIHRDDLFRNEAAACLAGVDAARLRKWDFGGSSIAYSADGSRLLIGGLLMGELSSNARVLYTGSDRIDESRQPGFGPVTFAPNGDALQWSVVTPWSYVLWNVTRQAEVASMQGATLEELQSAARFDPFLVFRVSLAMSSDGSLIAASAPLPDEQGEWPEDRGRCRTWNHRGELLHEIQGEATALQFAPDNSLLAIGRSNGAIDVLSLTDGRVVVTLRQDPNRIYCLDFTPDPAREGSEPRWLLAAGAAGGNVTIWDVSTGMPRSHCRGSPYDVLAVRFSPDGMTLASGGIEVRLWDYHSGTLILESTGASAYITGLAYSPDGRNLAVASDGAGPPEAWTTLWSIENGRGIAVLRGLSGQVEQTCFSVDGQQLAALSHTWEIAVYDTGPIRLKHLLQGPRGYSPDNAALAFSHDGTLLAASAGEEVCIWDAESGALVARHALPPGMVDQLAFTPGGKLVSLRSECVDGQTRPYGVPHADYPRVLRLRHLAGDEPLRLIKEFPRFNRHVDSACAHPEGRFFVVDGRHSGPEGDTQEIIALDGETGAQMWQRPHEQPCDSPWLAIDPFGKWLSCSSDEPGFTDRLIAESGEFEFRTAHAIALGADGDVFLSHGQELFDGSLGAGFSVHDDTHVRYVVGIDFQGRGVSPRFSRDGRLAFGTKEGLVILCDLDRISEELNKVGF